MIMREKIFNSIYFNIIIGQLFKGIDWGTDKVLQQQIEAASVLGLKLKLLATELNDIVSDLLHIVNDTHHSPLDFSPSFVPYPPLIGSR